ncbi:MAG: helicase RepA family protein [Candidatus Thiodiazotropha lotti]|nr:helicase RepA family protein [Candidatus Thiodiazotropha lotti]
MSLKYTPISRPEEMQLESDQASREITLWTPSCNTRNDLEILRTRPFILPKILIRGYISCILAPGGVGKSSFIMGLALSVSLNRPLMGIDVLEQCNVLVINNEDDLHELWRRYDGFIKTHNINDEDTAGRFFLHSGYSNPVVISRQFSDGEVFASYDLSQIKELIKKNNIGVICIDPFISTHEVSENDNKAIDKVIGHYKQLAHDTDVAILLVHHTRKNGSDSEAHAGDAESGRGASALKDATRSVLTLARMNEATAEQIGMDSTERSRYFRLDIGKLNFDHSDYDVQWFHMDSIQISNGDDVGVPVPVNLKPLFDHQASSKNKAKWHCVTVAESLERVIKKGSKSVRWPDIRAAFCIDNEIGKTRASDLITLISQDSSNATRIRVGGIYIEYWISKEGNNTSPWMIHRQEISE